MASLFALEAFRLRIAEQAFKKSGIENADSRFSVEISILGGLHLCVTDMFTGESTTVGSVMLYRADELIKKEEDAVTALVAWIKGEREE